MNVKAGDRPARVQRCVEDLAQIAAGERKYPWNHFSLSHVGGKTALIWRNDGTQHPGYGRRTDWHTWSHDLIPQDVHYGDRFIEFGERNKGWRIGDVDGTHMSITFKLSGKTCVIFRSDGTVHPGYVQDASRQPPRSRLSPRLRPAPRRAAPTCPPTLVGCEISAP